MIEDEFLAGWDETVLLLDCYESLLSPAQQDALRLYFRFNLSLGEIAEEKGITRAGASDALRKGVAKLRYYESCLGLGKKTLAVRACIEAIAEASTLEGCRNATQSLKEAFDDGI